MSKIARAPDADDKPRRVKDNDRVIVVLTADTVESILGQGGSGAWVINPDKANDCRYIVCCRKLNWNNRKEGIENRAAFLIGVVAGLREWADSANARGQLRYVIEISEYALIAKPGAWGADRNPVAYRTLKDLGIDLRGVKFKPVPKEAGGKSEGPSSRRMTIAEAKKALAESFGVSPDDVEITIRG